MYSHATCLAKQDERKQRRGTHQQTNTTHEQGFIYELKLVYAHFPINVAIVDDGKKLEIRNFVGQKRLFTVPMREGAIVKMADAKDTLEVWGDDLEAVSGSASDIQQSVRVRKKDIRKFLDGIYVSDKRHIVEIEEE